MSEAFVLSSEFEPAVVDAAGVRPLAGAEPGDRGVIVKVAGVSGAEEAVVAEELERRLLEMGFVEGATIEVLHQGLFGRDPIAVRVDDTRVALRRREAGAVSVLFEGGRREAGAVSVKFDGR
ncbi:ferrous iron transport protein A [Caulobacter segnis]|uniref:FeoA family protein n=2 Tax=Caulobacter segnis TaxID=88688 RepID=D5VNM0_CAUST|nr:FeoA family protein [Caulobacter segnis]ADG12093.1 FeoA family protein [Caulobacter segnis ATCC 21756]AVQ03703.1 ferrous iron transport protein A [Caulobacter segnis]